MTAGQMLECAVVDHVNLRGIDTEAVDKRAPAVVGVDDDRVDAFVQAHAELAAALGVVRAASRSWAVSTTGPRGSRNRSSAGTVGHWKWTTSASRANRR